MTDAPAPDRTAPTGDPSPAVDPTLDGDPFAIRLAEMRDRERRQRGRRQLWHAHHWPQQYGQRCVRIGSRHWCRRCLALYPLGLLVAILSALGVPPWPEAVDPALIWILSIPATVAFVGEAIGTFAYRPRWQVGSTLFTAVGFGRALGYELTDRWSAEFWQPVAIFGGIWFLASVFQHQTARPGTGDQ